MSNWLTQHIFDKNVATSLCVLPVDFYGRQYDTSPRIRPRQKHSYSVTYPMPNAARTSLAELIAQLAEQEADIRLGGGQAAI